MKLKHLPIIINPSAGRPEPVLSILNDVFKGSKIEWDVLIVKKIGDAMEFAKALSKRGEQLIAVYGGDGTVMEAISGLQGCCTPLAILPGGTGNVMAVDLGLPWDLRQGCEMLRDGNYDFRPIDIAKMGKHYFMLRTCLGFEADMVKDANRETKHRFGRLAYFFSAMGAMKKIKLTDYEITIDGKTRHEKGLTCIVANSGSAGFGDLKLARKVDVSDGLLDVLVIKKFDFSLVRYIFRVLTKKNPDSDRELVGHWQGKEITVASDPAQDVVCDGEVVGKIKIRAEVLPQSIEIAVPKKEKAAIAA